MNTSTRKKGNENECLDVMVGKKIRALRMARGLSLKDVAERSGLSMGFLSQAERGLSSPSLRSLGQLSEVFSVSIANFFPERESSSDANGPVLRESQRPSLVFWGTGITKEILTPPQPCENAELVTYLMCIEPQGSSGDETFTHEGLEAGFILEGSLEIQIDEDTFILEQGDGFRFSSRVPHRFLNITKTPTRIMWVNYRQIKESPST